MNKLTKKDLGIGIILAIGMIFLSCLILGYFVEGIDAPYQYNAGDDYSIINQIKQLTQESWLWTTDRLGAPYGQQVFDYASFFLQIPEYLFIKILTLFSSDVPVIENLLYLFTFVFCSLSAYIVLRKMSIHYFFAVCGSILYAYTPYIFERRLSHYCLTACYFVPVSIYLCYATYIKDDYFKLNIKSWNKKTVAILLLCACIATNGIGYYPFFTCFLLCVSAFCKFIQTRKIKSILPQIRIILCIGLFMLLALLPTILYHRAYGSNPIATRDLYSVEVYSLKITQLFMPIYSHGITKIQEFINEYNMHTPLTNENTTSYLGVIGGIGFIIGLIGIFAIRKVEISSYKIIENKKSKKTNKIDNRNIDTDEKICDATIPLMARFNLACVLFMSIGGFISLLAVLTKLYVMRGFNRISIYIMFCSLVIICSVAQSKYNQIKDKKKKMVFCCIVCLITLFGVWDQTPQLINDGSSLRANRERWNADEAFIGQIEAVMNEGDMIFQLPYHQYPEAGSVNNMTDYQLLEGYIHSDTLRWSYGGLKGRESDAYSAYVTSLDTESMINKIVADGFKGLYIDKRAYTEESLLELRALIEDVISTSPMESTYILFYNLYEYAGQKEN